MPPSETSDARLSFQSAVDLLLYPVAAFRLVGLDIDVVDEGAQVFQRVQVQEELVHIVGHLLLVGVLQAKTLLVKLANAVDAFADVVIVDERLARLILVELEKQDGVALVLLGCLGRRVHDLRAS